MNFDTEWGGLCPPFTRTAWGQRYNLDRAPVGMVLPFGRIVALVLALGFGINAVMLFVRAIRLETSSTAAITQGRKLYSQHCASCHGANLNGEPDWQTPKPTGRMPAPPHDASGHTWHHSERELHQITKLGMAAVVPNYESDMPAFGGILPDEDITAILAYLKSTWTDEARHYHEEQSRRR